MMIRDEMIIWLFSNKSTKFFVNMNTFLEINWWVFYMTNFLFNVYWFLHILKPTLLPHANTQSPDVIAYLPVDYTTSWIALCSSLAVYNQVKKLTTGKCTSVLGQKKSDAHWRVGVLLLIFRQIHEGFKVCI